MPASFLEHRPLDCFANRSQRHGYRLCEELSNEASQLPLWSTGHWIASLIARKDTNIVFARSVATKQTSFLYESKGHWMASLIARKDTNIVFARNVATKQASVLYESTGHWIASLIARKDTNIV